MIPRKWLDKLEFCFVSVFFFSGVTGKLTFEGGGGDAGRRKFPDESAFGGVPN